MERRCCFLLQWSMVLGPQQTQIFKSLTAYYGAVALARTPQEIHTLKFHLQFISDQLRVKPRPDILAETRATVDQEQVSTSKVPAYFAGLQEWLDPRAAMLEANHKHATTPKGNAEPMEAVRDLCR